MKPVGKLRPVIILIENIKMLNDGIKILEYKIVYEKGCLY